MFSWLRSTVRTVKIVRRFTLPLFYFSRTQTAYINAEMSQDFDAAAYRHAGDLLKAIVESGPTFIKFGQILASRGDILPLPYLKALSTLHDEVPPFPFEQVKKQVEEELGPIQRVFEKFEEVPLASASLGQVHRAVLSGREVAVKIRRPKIIELVNRDISILRRSSPFFRLFMQPYQTAVITRMISSFSKTVLDEMDYELEASNLLRIKRNMEDRTDVLVPALVPEYCTSRILVTEYVSGIKITDLEAIDKAGIDRRDLARRVYSVFMGALFGQDIFHADPHPGNISVKEDGRVVLYDFGMVGSLDSPTKQRLVRFYYAMLVRDPERAMKDMVELGLVNPKVDPSLVCKSLELVLRYWEDRSVMHSGFKEVVSTANSMFQKFPIQLTPEVAQVTNMADVLEGVCVTVDSEFDILDGLADALWGSGFLEGEISQEADENAAEFWKLIRMLPRLPTMFNELLNNGEELARFLSILDGSRVERVDLAIVTGTVAAVLFVYFVVERMVFPAVLSVITGTILTLALLLRRRRPRR